MTLLGGIGTIFGPIAGAALIVSMQNYLATLGEWVLVIQGAIFVACVMLFRRGIVGEIIEFFRVRRATAIEAAKPSAPTDVAKKSAPVA
jgi:branched-chain amino acid transport system permease protein